MVRVLHVIPEDGLGGAELAARRTAERLGDRFTLVSLTGGPEGARPSNVVYLGGRGPLDLGAAWRAARLARDHEVALFSLWKAMPALILSRFLAPRARRVLFLHSDRRVHLADTWLSWLGAWFADEIWADSESSIRGFAGLARRDTPRRVISFVMHRPQGRRRTEPSWRFIFWGRLNILKRLDRIVGLFAAVAARRPEARLTLVGPDAGTEASTRRQVAELGLDDRVRFTGPLSFDEICAEADRHDVFFQLSDQEGAAMALVEAMQLGLACVVTPVGEMGRYVRHMESGVIYESEAQAALDIERMLENPELFARISAQAIDLWDGRRLYEDDVIAAAQALAAREV
jgi:glycosyltransferase involved in cell wall biosynthesis